MTKPPSARQLSIKIFDTSLAVLIVLDQAEVDRIQHDLRRDEHQDEVAPRKETESPDPEENSAQSQNRLHRHDHAVPLRAWHNHSGYSRRSLVENAVYRYKTIIGRCMRSRSLEGQRVEVELASKILNTMTSLGMPDSYRVA